MPVISLFPNGSGAGNDTAWTLGAGASKLAAVQTNDGDTTYIQDSTATNRQSFDMDDLPAVASAVNGEPVGHALVRNTGTARNFKIYFKLSVNADGTAQNTTGSYIDYNDTPLRPGGGAWSVADVNAFMAGVQTGGTGTGILRCTQIYVVVDYVAGSGGYMFLLTSWVGTAIGLAEIPRLAAHLFRVSGRHRHLIRPEEYAAVLRDLLAPRPRYFFRPAAGLWLPVAYSTAASAAA